MARASLALIAASALRRRLGGNVIVLTNSAAIVAGNLTTALLGFGYWWLAARLYPAASVGLASALVSVMALVGMLGEFGMGTLLEGETLRHRGKEQGLITAALAVAFVCSAILGLGYAVLPGWSLAKGGAAQMLLVCGCALTGFALVLDHAFSGLLKSPLRMWRNIAFSAVKLLLLTAFAGIFPTGEGEAAILASWAAAIAASVVLLAGGTWRSRPIVAARPDFALLRQLSGKVVDHHLLNLASQAPALMLPLLLSMMISPEANAAFYPAWMLITIAALVPSAFTAVVYTLGMSHPGTAAERLRFSLAVSAVCATATGLVFFVFSQEILGLFNPAYPEIAGSSLRLLGFGVLGLLVKHHYIAVARIAGRMRGAAVFFALAGVGELGLAALGIAYAGLPGMAVGWLAALVAETLLMLRPVLVAGHAAPVPTP
jgi:O-antigen/teichoic acid export membrane protein